MQETQEVRQIKVALVGVSQADGYARSKRLAPGKPSAIVAIPDGLRTLDLGELKGSDDGQFSVLTIDDGDKRVVWNRLNLPEVRDAKKMFDDLVTKGLVPYSVGLDGNASSVVMDQFDPNAEEVVFLPMALVAGG